MQSLPGPREVVATFLSVVRSGAAPERAVEFLAPRVLAHQMHSEHPVVVERTPEDYAEHVREMLQTYGQFDFEVDELIAEGEKVYARWTQQGRHLGEIAGVAPTGAPIVEIASCVYRVVDGAITEYWIQIDRAGLAAQLS